MLGADGRTRENRREAAARAAARAHLHRRPRLVLRAHRGQGFGAAAGDEPLAARAGGALRDDPVCDRTAGARRPAASDRHAPADRGRARLRARRRPQAALVLALVALAAAPAAAAKLPPLPHGLPPTLQLGLADGPGGAAALRAHAPFGLRYQYLAGGVDTGHGWSTWNPDGAFASMYVRESWAQGTIPVLTYYMLLQSSARVGDEAQTDLDHLHDQQLMQA